MLPGAVRTLPCPDRLELRYTDSMPPWVLDIVCRSHRPAICVLLWCSALGTGCGQSPPWGGEPDARAQCPAIDPIPNLPSVQQVRFEFSTTTPEQPTFVLTEAENCQHFFVHRPDGVELPLAAPHRPVCEGPPPPSPYFSGSSLASAPVITWDARDLRHYTACTDCADFGWPEFGLAFHDVHVWQPVMAGDYQATFLVADEVDDPCQSLDGQTLECYESSNWWDMDDPCPLMGRTVTVDFTVPEVGDVVVPVVIDAL